MHHFSSIIGKAYIFPSPPCLDAQKTEGITLTRQYSHLIMTLTGLPIHQRTTNLNGILLVNALDLNGPLVKNN